MRIIGIDPGTATTGFSIIDSINGNISLLDYGCIKTAPGLSDATRLKQISDDMKTLIKKWKPTRGSIEKLYFKKNVKTAIQVAQARGVIMQNMMEEGIEPVEYTPLEIKMAITGYGKADKKMVQQMIKMLLNMKTIPKPDDAADAIACAICLANSTSMINATK